MYSGTFCQAGRGAFAIGTPPEDGTTFRLPAQAWEGVHQPESQQLFLQPYLPVCISWCSTTQNVWRQRAEQRQGLLGQHSLHLYSAWARASAAAVAAAGVAQGELWEPSAPGLSSPAPSEAAVH